MKKIFISYQCISLTNGNYDVTLIHKEEIMKRFLIILLIFSFIPSVLLFANGSDEDTKGGAEGGKIKIGFAQNNVGIDSYQTTYDKTLKEAQKDYPNVELIILDAGGDIVRQSSQVDDLILQKVDVIVVWPTNGEAIVPAMKKASDAGIPVVVTNSMVAEKGVQYMTSFSGPDNITQGKYAAQLMNEALGGKGKIVQISGLPGYTTAIERQKGFEDELAVIAPGITIVDTQPGDWNREKSQRVMEDFLTKYSDIDGVYSADDNMGIGALNAAKAAGRNNLIFVGATCFAVGYDAIEAGEYYGSIYQSPVDDAKNAIQTAVDVAQGKTVEQFNYFDTPKISQENIDEFTRPVF